jgi:hypothetical protein
LHWQHRPIDLGVGLGQAEPLQQRVVRLAR